MQCFAQSGRSIVIDSPTGSARGSVERLDSILFSVVGRLLYCREFIGGDMVHPFVHALIHSRIVSEHRHRGRQLPGSWTHAIQRHRHSLQRVHRGVIVPGRAATQTATVQATG